MALLNLLLLRRRWFKMLCAEPALVVTPVCARFHWKKMLRHDAFYAQKMLQSFSSGNGASCAILRTRNAAINQLTWRCMLPKLVLYYLSRLGRFDAMYLAPSTGRSQCSKPDVHNCEPPISSTLENDK
jgi:hypothetical protein